MSAKGWRWRVGIVLGVICLCQSAIAAEAGRETQPVIHLVSSMDTRLSPLGRWLELVYREAFSRLGYRLDYQGYPGGRAPLLAERGEVDGEIHRAAEYLHQTANLIRVPEPHFQVSYVAYAVKPGLAVQGWLGLGQLPGLRVEYRRGAKHAETMLNEMIKPESLDNIATTEQGLRKLVVGRSDIFVEQELVLEPMLARLRQRSHEFDDVYRAGLLESVDTYAYLYKEHAALARQLADTLRAMKQEGLIERYRLQAIDMDQ